MTVAWNDLSPALHPDPYVFTQVEDLPPGPSPFAIIREDGGPTVFPPEAAPARPARAYGYVAARITLTITTDLAAVGLTAEVSRVLAEAGISCNVIAGLVHDHLFVDAGRGPEALRRLKDL